MPDAPELPVAELLAKSEAELWEAIARTEFPAAFGFTKAQRERMGKGWFEERVPAVRKVICANANLRALIAADAEPLDVVMAVVPVVLVVFPGVVSATAIACAVILTLRIFGRSMCDGVDVP